MARGPKVARQSFECGPRQSLINFEKKLGRIPPPAEFIENGKFFVGKLLLLPSPSKIIVGKYSLLPPLENCWEKCRYYPSKILGKLVTTPLEIFRKIGNMLGPPENFDFPPDSKGSRLNTALPLKKTCVFIQISVARHDILKVRLCPPSKELGNH